MGDSIHKPRSFLDQVFDGLISSGVLNGDGRQPGCLTEEIQFIRAKMLRPSGIGSQDTDDPVFHD